jgi:hypothetical protein
MSQVKRCTETLRQACKAAKEELLEDPQVLKPLVDDYVDNILKKGITEPNMSPWSSIIVVWCL